MKPGLLLLLALVCIPLRVQAYSDHRGRNVDSLETVMAGWTAAAISSAAESTLEALAGNANELMWGFCQTNPVKSEYYARMLLGISRRMGWIDYECAAAKIIGSHFWARECYDSAAVYYGLALDAASRMPVLESGADHIRTYDAEDRDDALSQMYGSLGNLYSMMDSIDVAMDYYTRAGEIFGKHDWHNSSATLYYNMGETMRFEDNVKAAEGYYRKSLEHSLLSGDSLAVATAYKGLGSLYMETGRTSRAMRYLEWANAYFANHEKEELQFRMESLDYTGKVLALQKKRLWMIVLLLAAVVLLSGVSMFVSGRLKRAGEENKELAQVLEETVEQIGRAPETNALKPKEREILGFIANGYTNAQIAEAMSLSSETIKWYKKKLFVLFEASNSAELVRIATERGIL